MPPQRRVPPVNIREEGEPPQDAPREDRLDRLADGLERLERIVQGLVGQQQQHPPPPPPPVAHPPQMAYVEDPFRAEFMALMRQFRRVHSAEFRGDGPPIDAENWIREIKKNLRAVRCPPHHQVALARQHLRDDADDWWETVEEKYGRPLSWDEFQEEFEARYFSQTHKDRLVLEFSRLIQAKLSVSEYAATFRRLLRFASQSVPTERSKVVKFLNGLRPSL